MLNVSAHGRETSQKHLTKYSIQTRKMVRGAVLDLPSKGKLIETCIAEGDEGLSSLLRGPVELVVICPSSRCCQIKVLQAIKT